MTKQQGISTEHFRAQYSEAVQELKAQLKEKDRVLGEYRKAHGKLELFFSEIKENLTPITPLPKVFKPSADNRKVSSSCAAVAHVTDGHCGEQQFADEIEGFGEFNYKICRSRQLAFVARVNRWILMHRPVYTVDELHVVVTGDLISGDIHDELSRTNEFPVPVQCKKAAEILASQVALWSPNFERVVVHFLVADNHSRLTRKPQSKEEGMNSFNYVVGHMAELYCSKHDNVEFNIYPVHERVIHISTRQYLISHGHAVRGWMGIPWYSIVRKLGKEATARMQIIMEEVQKAQEKARRIGFNKYVFGHWHVPINYPLFSCGGSVGGTNAHDHTDGRHANPSQSAWIVHPKYGEFDRTDFDLRFT